MFEEVHTRVRIAFAQNSSLMLQWRLCFSYASRAFVLLLCFNGGCTSLTLKGVCASLFALIAFVLLFCFNGVCASLLLLFPSAFLWGFSSSFLQCSLPFYMSVQSL